MRSLARARRVGALLALMAWTQACFASTMLPPNASIPRGRQLSVRSTVPFPVVRSNDADRSDVLCYASAVQGRFLRAGGDTLVLDVGQIITTAREPDGGFRKCPTNMHLSVVRTTATEVRQEAFDAGRTVGLTLVIGVVVVALATAAASRIPLGCVFCVAP